MTKYNKSLHLKCYFKLFGGMFLGQNLLLLICQKAMVIYLHIRKLGRINI